MRCIDPLLSLLHYAGDNFVSGKDKKIKLKKKQYNYVFFKSKNTQSQCDIEIFSLVFLELRRQDLLLPATKQAQLYTKKSQFKQISFCSNQKVLIFLPSFYRVWLC